MIRAEITFYGKYNGGTFGSEKAFKNKQQIERYIQHMEDKGFYLNEVHYL